MGSRVELYAAIRRDVRVEGLSIRELAVRHWVHRRTVRQTLASAFPPPRKTPVRLARSRRDRGVAWGDRAGRDRGDRFGLPDVAAADHAGPVR